MVRGSFSAWTGEREGEAAAESCSDGLEGRSDQNDWPISSPPAALDSVVPEGPWMPRERDCSYLQWCQRGESRAPVVG